MSGASPDPWHILRSRTSARIALGRAGASLPTAELLAFELAHARARDAVHAPLKCADLETQLEALGLTTVQVESEASDRQTYLRRPDCGRRLSAASRARLSAAADKSDLVLLIGDGLSAAAAVTCAPLVVAALLPELKRLNLSLGPVVVAEGARVALGDEVGEIFGARMVVVAIGERPGLSAANTLSLYLTYAPRPGRTDAERNCISNIRAGGLEPALAANNLAWLIEAALKIEATGVALKDRSDLHSTSVTGTATTIDSLPPASDL